MERLRGEQADAAVAMLLIVPVKERPAVAPRLLNAEETIREIGPVLEGFKLGFGKGVVIAGVRPAVGLGYAKLGQEEGHGL